MLTLLQGFISNTLLLLAVLLTSVAIIPTMVDAQPQSRVLQQKDSWARLPIASLGLAYELFGLAPYPLTSRGFRFMVGLTPEISLTLSRLRSEKQVLLSDYTYRESELRISKYMDKITKIGLGIGYRSVDISYEVFVDNSSVAEVIMEQHRSLSITAHFGLEYRITQHIIIGSDIFGISSPVYWIKQDNRYPKNARDFEEDPKGFPFFVSGFNLNMQFIRTYVAVEF